MKDFGASLRLLILFPKEMGSPTQELDVPCTTDGLSSLPAVTGCNDASVMSITRSSVRERHERRPPRKSRTDARRSKSSKDDFISGFPSVYLIERDPKTTVPYDSATNANIEVKHALKTFKGGRLVAGEVRKITLQPGKRNFQLWLDGTDEVSLTEFWRHFAQSLAGGAGKVSLMSVSFVKSQMKKDKAFKKKQESREDLLCGHGLKAIANLSQLLQSNPNTKKRNAHAADLMDLFKATHMKTQEKVKTKNGRNLSEVMEDLKDAIEEDEESADYVDALQSEEDEVDESLDEEQK